jgi:hypothetical protein
VKHILRLRSLKHITQSREEVIIIFVNHTLITSLCDSVSRLASSGVPGITVRKETRYGGIKGHSVMNLDQRVNSKRNAQPTQSVPMPMKTPIRNSKTKQSITKQNKANQPTIQSTIKAAVQGTTHPICSPHRSSTLATTQRVSRQKLTLAGRSTDKTLKPGRAKGSRWGVMRKGTVQP